MQKYHCNIIGFTLIELLVTLAVLAIFISSGLSAYSHIFSQQELIQRTERIYHFLRLANSQAIKYNKKVYVHFCQLDDTEIWKMAMAEQPHCDCFVDSSCRLNNLQLVQDLADGKTLSILPSELTFSGEQASYSPMRFSVNPGRVTLTDRSGKKLSVVQSTMRLRICAPEQAILGYKKC